MLEILPFNIFIGFKLEEFCLIREENLRRLREYKHKTVVPTDFFAYPKAAIECSPKKRFQIVSSSNHLFETVKQFTKLYSKTLENHFCRHAIRHSDSLSKRSSSPAQSPCDFCWQTLESLLKMYLGVVNGH